MKSIPIIEAEHLAKIYGYDQVIIYARNTNRSNPPRESMTAFGKTRKHNNQAMQLANYLKFDILGWQQENS